MARSIHHALALLALTFSAACVASADVVEVPVDRAGALILVTVPQDRSPPEVLALDVARPGTVGVPASSLRAGTLHALTYDCRLSALELGEGALTVVASELEGRGLPAPASIAIATATGWSAGPSSPPSSRACGSHTLPSSARRARRFGRRASPCPRWRATTSTSRWRSTIARCCSARALGPVPDTGFERGPSLSMPGTCVRAAASPPGQPLEAFAATCEGSVMRFDGARWTTITIGDTTRQPPSLAWAAPGEVYVAGTHPPAVVRFVDGELLAEDVPVPSRDSASLVVVNPVLGPLAGTDVGSLFRKTAEGWVSLAALSSLQRIRVALPIEGGTLFGGGGGELVQYYDEYGLCPPEAAVAGHVWTAAVLGETLAVVVVGVRGSVVVYLDCEPVPEKVWPAACPAE